MLDCHKQTKDKEIYKLKVAHDTNPVHFSMKTKADQLLHPALTVVLKIKILFTTIAIVAGVVKIFQNLDTAMMADWFDIFLAVAAIYGAWLMLQTKKLGFYLVAIPNLITGIMSLFYLPYMAKGVWMSFGQIAFVVLLMLLRRDGKNAYQVLWGNANMIAENEEESKTPELEGKPEETPRNLLESDLWERIEVVPEDTVEQIHYKLGLLNTYVDNYPNGLEIDKAMSLLDCLEQKMEKMREKEDEGINLWRHIETLPEDDITKIQDKMDLIFSFINHDYLSDLKYEAESLWHRLRKKMEIWVNMNNSGTEELGGNKSLLLQQVKQVEHEVSMGMMSQDAFVAKLKELLGHYSDLRIEDYRGWINEDSYNKLIEAVF